MSAEIIAQANRMKGGDPVNDLALILMRGWGKADPRSNVSKYPASYIANFADMARAVIAAGWTPPPVPLSTESEAGCPVTLAHTGEACSLPKGHSGYRMGSQPTKQATPDLGTTEPKAKD